MVTIVLFWLYSSGLFYLYGWLAIRIIKHAAPARDERPVNFTTTWLTGLWVTTTLANYFSLFSKLGLLVNILLLIGAAGILALMILKKEYPRRVTIVKMPWQIWLLLILITLTVLEKASHPVTNSDTGLYHAQAIRWMETYPVVPGLGALHARFAFNSSWLTTNALLSFSFLGFRSLHLVSSTLFLVFQLYLVRGVLDLFRGNVNISSLLKLLMIPVSFYVIISQISAPGTDLPAAVLVWYVLLEWISQAEKNQQVPLLQLVLLSLLALFAVTIKLNTFPILLVAVYTLFRLVQGRQWNFILSLIITGILIYTPWLSRYVILSGYLVFPFPGIDLFNVDWKIPAWRVQEDMDAIRAWQLIPGQDAAITLAMPFSEWFPLWFARHTTNQKGILLVTAIGPFFWLILSLMPNRTRNAVRHYFSSFWWAYFVTYAGVFYWYTSAPKFRYGYGFLMMAFLLVLAPIFTIFKDFLQKYSARLATLSVGLLILFQAFILVQSFQSETIANRLILPSDYLTLSTSPCQIEEFTFWCAEWYDECWYDPFPCIPKVDPMVEFRTGALEDGFRYSPGE